MLKGQKAPLPEREGLGVGRCVRYGSRMTIHLQYGQDATHPNPSLERGGL